jgi:cysteinyl-tRNA synthetase
MIRFHNTLSGKVEAFAPIEPGLVKLYTCGPTVYDFPHIGNWRAYVFEDLLKRFLVFSGYKVAHVMNITDVDDKTIRGANARGVGLEEYTRPFIEAVERERDILNILPADHYPRATGHIPEMVEIIKSLLAKGFAYRKDGSIYFAIEKFPSYGRLSKINLEDLRPGRRGDADEYEKESVHDFALWKAPKEGEPVWETEIGPGRPGWHVECSAMSSKYLGRTFDIHCGGVDNIFPHHENEIAQSEAANGVKFVNYWLHCHHLVVDGEKMAKSKGNFHTLGDILERGYDPLDVRYLLISTHYRKMLNFTFDELDQAKAARGRVGNFLGALKDITKEGPVCPEIPEMMAAARSRFVESLEDDLNISEALGSIFDFVTNMNALIAQDAITKEDAQKILDFYSSLDKVLAIKPSPVRSAVGKIIAQGRVRGLAPVTQDQPEDADSILEKEVLEKIEARNKARLEKDYARADAIRKDLLSLGILLEDTKDGVLWKKAEFPIN